jgi:hypothetical protein
MASLSGPSFRKYVTPVTVMLSFVSFWRASAIVLCDFGSSAYYVGGIAEKAIGKPAPWFILAIMLFSYAVGKLLLSELIRAMPGETVSQHGCLCVRPQSEIYRSARLAWISPYRRIARGWQEIRHLAEPHHHAAPALKRPIPAVARYSAANERPCVAARA